jgi:hypothetical protein
MLGNGNERHSMYERRMEERAQVHLPAWMEGPNRLLPCVLSNLSWRGGEITVSPDIAVPKQFALRLTEDGKIRRGCNVVWRRDDRVGISFFRLETATPSRFLP